MNAIFESLAFLEGYKSSYEDEAKNNKSLYLMNAVISLISYKRNNGDDDVFFLTNFELPQDVLSVLLKEQIKSVVISFDDFIFEGNIRYSLAYFKLCAWQYMVKNYHYEKYLLVDCDTYCCSSLNLVWKEADFHIMALEMAYNLDNEKKYVYSEYAQLYNKKTQFSYYGSEFICANGQFAYQLITKCKEIYLLMINKNIRSKAGDEFIWNVAYENFFRGDVKNSHAYVMRVFTMRPYIIRTDFDLMVVLHCPLEKETGFLKLYNHYIKTKKLYSLKNIYRVFGLKKINRAFFQTDYIHFKWLLKRAVDKIK